MSAMRLLRLGLLAAIVLAVSGCGATKQSGSIPEGAELAPASAAFYMVGITDPESAQWDKADKLLGRFPGRGKLLDEFRKELRKDNLSWERDVRPALPDEIHLVALDFEGDSFVAYAKPKDEAKFNKLLESGDDPSVHRKIDGWTVFSDTNTAIDKFASAQSASEDSLADTDAFKDAMGELPDDAAVRGYLSGERLYALLAKEAATDPDAKSFQRFSSAFGKLESLSFSAAAQDEGVWVEAATKSNGQGKVGNFSPELEDTLPADALAYASFGNLEDYLATYLEAADKNFPQFKQGRTQLEQALGFSLRNDLFPLFSKEGAVAFYSGGELSPNVLFVLRVPDEAKAKHILDRLAALATLSGDVTVRPFSVHGAQGKQFLSPDTFFSIFAVVLDGKAFVSNSKALIEIALGDSKKLGDDAVYRDARDAADAPDDTAGFVYLNLDAGLPYVFDLANASEPGSITPDVTANTKPLESALLYAKQDGDRTTLSGFLAIK